MPINEPVVAFLRCKLREAEAAREMSHAFFAEMLAGGTIRTVDRELKQDTRAISERWMYQWRR